MNFDRESWADFERRKQLASEIMKLKGPAKFKPVPPMQFMRQYMPDFQPWTGDGGSKL